LAAAGPYFVTELTGPCIPTLAPGARLRAHLLVVEIERRRLGSRDATLLTLANGSGRLPSAPLWDEARHQVAGLAPGNVVEVWGRVGTYRGRRQLEIESIRSIPRELVDPRTLLPALANADSCWSTLDRWRAEIRSAGLARVTGLFYDDPTFRRLYQECPASPSGHHAALGGLLWHTFEVASIARAIVAVAGADRDLVLAGALLHDIGKLEAYTWSGPFELSQAGALLGHVALGARMLDRRVREAADPPCSGPELDLLLHLVLSHHGRLEFGAAIEPMTLEAEILHYADDASAKSASMAEAVRDPANFTGSGRLSSRIWQLDRRRVYRGGGEFSADEAIPLKAEQPPSRG
jgi:3'-5' exoribonuclease